METIYSHNPTSQELECLGLATMPKTLYEAFDSETHWFDLALLFRLRKDGKNEARAWSHIPFRRDEFLRGFDCYDKEG